MNNMFGETNPIDVVDLSDGEADNNANSSRMCVSIKSKPVRKSYSLMINEKAFVISKESVERLRHPQRWLNDEVINWYCSHLIEQYKGDWGNVKLFTYFDSKFFTNQPMDFSAIQEHVAAVYFSKSEKNRKQYRAFEESTCLVFPICHNNHWFLVIVENPLHAIKYLNPQRIEEGKYQKCQITVLDSMLKVRASRHAHLYIIAFLACVYEDSLASTLPRGAFSPHRIECRFPTVPQQENLSDCSTFMFQYLEAFLKAKKEKDMTKGWRRLTIDSASSIRTKLLNIIKASAT